MPLLLTLATLGVAVVLAPVLDRVMGRSSMWILAALYVAATVFYWPAARDTLDGQVSEWSKPWVSDLGVNFALRADGISTLFVLIALLIGAAVLIYSTRYLARGSVTSFSLVMAMFTLSMVVLVMADDLILLFIAWELTSIASFLLIARSGAGAQGPCMRTLLITFLGGLMLLAGISVTIAATGTTSVSEALASPVWQENHAIALVVAAFVILAAFTKSAQFPFHVWLPDAMAAATPVSAYLHAAAVVKAGIFLLMRFSPAFHDLWLWNASLIAIGLLTSLVGAWGAINQDDLKKLMAFSTVSQLGLIVAAIGVGSEYGLIAAVTHTIAHALFKSGLFMMVGVVDHATGTRDVRRLPSLWRKMPVAFAVTTIGAASMAGIPPMLGFVSKEGILAALHHAPGPAWVGWVTLVVAGFGAVLTFTYSAKIVFAGFVDGRGDRPVHLGEWGLVTAACVPIVASVPLIFMLSALDNPVARAVEAALPGTHPHPHLSLWHGVTPELIVTLLVMVAGVWIVLRRAALRPTFRRQLPGDGVSAIGQIASTCRRLGVWVGKFVAKDTPTRHLAPLLTMFAVVALTGAIASMPSADPFAPNLNRTWDVLILIPLAVCVAVVCASRQRLTATVALSGVGILATVQILTLGAPDVGLTQLLVESLTIVVIMLVLQKLPRTFHKASRSRHRAALFIAIACGLGAGAGTWMFSGRRERSDIAMTYLNEGPEITGGDNIVNTILVEFRAFDTLGELSVLGMAGIAIIAVLSTVRHRFLDPPRRLDAPGVEDSPGPLRPAGSTAHRAITAAWPNAIPLQLMLRVVVPLLSLISLWIFYRGHNSPGGGFIAALVASAALALSYLSTSRDRALGPPRAAVFLIGFGIAIALITGFIGYTGGSSFLEPLHGYIGAEHVSTSMLFDVGVYLAVLGLMLVAINLLGTSAATAVTLGEETRERTDETVEGELPGPMDTTRGEKPEEVAETARRDITSGRRVGARSSHLAAGTRPKEVGRP